MSNLTIRKLKLYTHDKGKSFDLNDLSSFAHEITGLGVNLDLEYIDTNKGRFHTNTKANFEPVKFKITTNIKGYAYENFNKFMNFIASNGKNKLLLEHEAATLGKKYCEILFKSSTKTEIKLTGDFTEDITFDRLTYWFVEDKYYMGYHDARVQRFPLHFPTIFGREKTYATRIEIENNFFESLPVHIQIDGPLGTQEPWELKMTDDIDSMSLLEPLLVIRAATTGATPMPELTELDSLFIDPFHPHPNVTWRFNVNTLENPRYGYDEGYDMIDRRYDTFLFLPPGSHNIWLNDDSENGNGLITFTVRRFMLD